MKGTYTRLDLSKIWTDDIIYEHFNLTREEIDLIETTINKKDSQPMQPFTYYSKKYEHDERTQQYIKDTILEHHLDEKKLKKIPYLSKMRFFGWLNGYVDSFHRCDMERFLIFCWQYSKDKRKYRMTCEDLEDILYDIPFFIKQKELGDTHYCDMWCLLFDHYFLVESFRKQGYKNLN